MNIAELMKMDSAELVRFAFHMAERRGFTDEEAQARYAYAVLSGAIAHQKEN